MKKWQRAVQKYTSILEPINEKISLILKSKLSKHLDEPREIVQIFLKYDTVLRSPDIIDLLAAEREHFLHSLLRLMKELKDQLAEPRQYPPDADISEMCWETKTLKIFQTEVSRAPSVRSILFAFCLIFNFVTPQLNQVDKVMHLVRDIDGYDVVRKSLDDLKQETEKWLESNFDTWREQSLTAIARGDLT